MGLGAVALIGGVALVVVHLTQRGKNGYYTSSTKRVAASGYAITTEGLDIGDLPSFTTDAVGHVRVSARGSNGQPLFVGIAPQSAVNAYLAGVGRSEVTDVNGDTVSYRTHRRVDQPFQRCWFGTSSHRSHGRTTVASPRRGGRLDPRDPIAHTVGELRVESQAV